MKFLKDKKGVFGLNAVQSFFATILGLALLAFIIVIIMGLLSTTSILAQSSTTVYNETPAHVNTTEYTLATATTNGFANPVITQIWNHSAGGGTVYNQSIGIGNASVTSAGVVTNTVPATWNFTDVKISYTYSYDSLQQNNLKAITYNTSTGITGFFGSITPVYAILAVLVIILVLVVLVRVVQTPTGARETPQL